MAGETDLRALLGGMRPQLNPGRYVFTVTDGKVPPGVVPIVTVAEQEGLTLVVRLEDADAAGTTVAVFLYVASLLLSVMWRVAEGVTFGHLLPVGAGYPVPARRRVL